ncbi:MAG: NUDIX-like domain-containing protein, partial [Pseudomonadota bacterium]
MAFPLPTPMAQGGLDRVDALRRDDAELERLRDDPATRLVAFWRGDPALELGPHGPQLALVPPARGFFRLDPHPIFLGLDQGAARFAVDLSAVDREIVETMWPTPPRFEDA